MKYMAYITAVLGGICSLGYQFIVVPWLAPFIGATLPVWALVICAFILAYMLGSLVGGLVTVKAAPIIASLCPILLMVFQLFGSAPIKLLLAKLPEVAQYLIIGIWCFIPAFLLAILSPLNYKLISSDSKRASSLFNFCQAAGNIAGVLLVVGFLLPTKDLGHVLTVWTCLSIAWFVCWLLLVTSSRRIKLMSASLGIGIALISLALPQGKFNPYIPGLFESRITYAGWLGVADFGAERWLLGVYENNISAQSRMLRDSPSVPLGYIADMFKAAEKVYPGNVLQIGLGGGSFNKAFAARYPNSKLLTVEIDPVAEELAKKYFYLQDFPNHKVVIKDGISYLNTSELKEKYDWLIVDAYLGSKMDESFTQIDWSAYTRCLIVNHNGTVSFKYF
jgi:predicted membrane-bound spermidine synthase